MRLISPSKLQRAIIVFLGFVIIALDEKTVAEIFEAEGNRVVEAALLCEIDGLVGIFLRLRGCALIVGQATELEKNCDSLSVIATRRRQTQSLLQIRAGFIQLTRVNQQLP